VLVHRLEGDELATFFTLSLGSVLEEEILNYLLVTGIDGAIKRLEE
jgi:hypothetical protein